VGPKTEMRCRNSESCEQCGLVRKAVATGGNPPVLPAGSSSLKSERPRHTPHPLSRCYVAGKESDRPSLTATLPAAGAALRNPRLFRSSLPPSLHPSYPSPIAIPTAVPFKQRGRPSTVDRHRNLTQIRLEKGPVNFAIAWLRWSQRLGAVSR
jgi:hypothetical protein